VTAATPPAPYGTMEGALASGFATTKLHHSAGHDLVQQQAEEMLQDRAKLSEWLEQHVAASEIERGLMAASSMASALKDDTDAKGQKQILQTLFERITLSPTGIRFAVRRHALVQRLLSAIGSQAIADEASLHDDTNADIVVIDRPMAIKRRGTETRMVINGAGRREPDATLVDLIAKAHHYLNRLTDNSASSIADLATELSVHRADISRILPLAFLSPAITEAILTGRQPADLTAKTLSRLIDIPPAWSDQAQALGI